MNGVARRLFAACVLAASIGLIAAAPPQPTLLTVLAEIRRLDEASTLALVTWAGYPNPSPPDMVLSALDQTQVDVLELPPADRAAIVTWLSSGRRDALYARGLTDDDIGPCLPLIEPRLCSAKGSPTPAPGGGGSAASQMVFPKFEIQTPVGSGSHVRISDGFAAVRLGDGGEEIHCISYVNEASKTIAAVTFTYRILSASGGVLAAGSDIASLDVGPGGAVTAPPDWAAYQAAARAGAPPSCWRHPGLVSAANPRPPAVLAISVSAVTYDDGSHWPP